MHPAVTHVLAAACKGDWQQKLKCGWHQPTTTAANAGAFTGHSVMPWLIGAIIGLLIIVAMSKSRSGTPAASKS
jgi:hypothetical protein